MNLVEEGKEAYPIFISANLSLDLKQALLNHLKEFKDVFEWTCDEIPGLDLQFIMHHVNKREGTRTVKRASRNFRSELEMRTQIKASKMFGFGFINPITRLY